jgi:hypothetical protein
VSGDAILTGQSFTNDISLLMHNIPFKQRVAVSDKLVINGTTERLLRIEDGFCHVNATSVADATVIVFIMFLKVERFIQTAGALQLTSLLMPCRPVIIIIELRCCFLVVSNE